MKKCKKLAEERINEFSARYVEEQNTGYAFVRPFLEEKDNHLESARFALLPVWKYLYRYNGKGYPFYVNGQTGKVIGAPPIDWSRHGGNQRRRLCPVVYFS